MVIDRFLARVVAALALAAPAAASAALTVTPITWEVIGLDSNKPITSGPEQFPFGARVCNDSGTATGPMDVTMGLLAGSPNINFPTGSLQTVLLPSIPSAGTNNGSGPGCADAYFTVQVTRSTAAYTQTRPFTLSVNASGAPSPLLATFPATGTRQLYVEYLVSQNRNSISSVSLNGGPAVLSGGELNVVVGQTYTLTLTGKTATNGYEQLEAFLNLPNNLFRVEKVETTYSADTSAGVSSPNDKLYGDACVWENDPTSPNYKACLSTGKVGGNITVTYTLRVIGGGGTTHPLTALIYDFSGSSYHYNSDFGSFSVGVVIANPDVDFSKSFNPAAVNSGATSTLTFLIRNNGATTLADVAFTDPLPATCGTGQDMQVDDPALPTTSNCGSPTFSPAPGDTVLSFSGATIAPGATCTVEVKVKAPTGNGACTNTTDPLTIGGVSTGKQASAVLALSELSAPVVQKAFLTNPITTGSNTVLRFTITNPNASQQLAGISFTDAYPAGLLNASPFTVSSTCPTPYSAIALSPGPGLDFSGLTLAGGTSCTVDVTVTSSTQGTYDNTTSPITSTSTTLQGQPATASLVVNPVSLAPPGVSKAFLPAEISVGATSVLRITLTNPNNLPLTGIAFTDTFPTGLSLAATPNLNNTCGGTAGATANSLALSSGSLAASTPADTETCTISVNVVASQTGSYLNSISGVTATGTTGPGGPASATLVVTNPTPGISLGKFVRKEPGGPWLPSVVVAPGDLVSYRFEVSNTGNLPLTNIAIDDAQLPQAASCAWPASLPVPSETEPGTAACEITGLTAVAGVVTNTASASASGDGQTVISAPDSASYFGVTAILTLIKEVGTKITGPWTTDLLLPPGTPVYYRFTSINAGNVDITNVTVSDPDVNTASCGISVLPPGQARLCIVGPITPSASVGVPVVNTASASGTASGTGSPVNSDPATATYTPAENKIANLTVNKAGPALVVPNATVQYVIQVSNAGPSDADGAKVTDPSVAGFTASTVTCTAASTTPPAACPTPAPLSIAQLQGGGLTIPTLPSGGFIELTLTGSAGSSGSITNTANVFPPAGTFDPDLSDNTHSALTVISSSPSVADLAVLKLGPATATPGQSISYTITVANLPSSTVGVTNAIVSDPRPANIADYTSITCGNAQGGATCPGAIDTTAFQTSGVAIPSLPPGSSVDLTINATAGSSGAIFNYASVTAPPGGPLDPNPINNFSTAVTTISGGTLASVDLQVVKTGPSSIGSGGTLTYKILVKNKGPGDASGAKLFDVLAGTLSSPTVTCAKPLNSVANCPDPAGVTWANAISTGIVLDSMPAPSGADPSSLEFTVSGTAGSSGVVFNTASVSPPPGTYDSDPRDNSSSVSTVVISSGPGADLKVVKSGPPSATPGGTVTYTITVMNLGSVDANGALLRDPAVANFTATSVTCGINIGGSFCPSFPQVIELQSGIVIPTLPTGSSLVFTLEGIAGASGSIVNTATIFPPPGLSDPVLTNNASTVTTSLGGSPATGTVSGFVWYDTNGNNAKEPTEPPRGGWKVELVLGGSVVATTLTSADGFYSFAGLAPGSYTVRFASIARTAVPGGGPVNGDTTGNGGTPSGMELTGITVGGGASVLNQSLPIDPSGVVYDAAARTPVAGATVTLLFNGAPANPIYIAGGSNRDVSAAGGQYAFFLLPGAPTGTWGLRVDPTASYEGTASLLIPPTPAPAGYPGGSVGTVGVPPEGAVTTYYLAFPLPSIDITNNNIPLDAGKRIPTISPALLALLALLMAATSGWATLKRRRGQ